MSDITLDIERECGYSSTTGERNLGVTTEHPLMLFKVPSGASARSKKVSFRAGNLDNAQTIVKVYASPTVTVDGTALTINNKYIKSSPTAAQAEVYVNPTVTANGTLVYICVVDPGQGTKEYSNEFFLDANNQILFTVQHAVTGKRTHIDITWAEIPD